eukprot:scaffold95387_cov43-Cyclotella_meneghiniana.AAC.1
MAHQKQLVRQLSYNKMMTFKSSFMVMSVTTTTTVNTTAKAFNDVYAFCSHLRTCPEESDWANVK